MTGGAVGKRGFLAAAGGVVLETSRPSSSSALVDPQADRRLDNEELGPGGDGDDAPTAATFDDLG